LAYFLYSTQPNGKISVMPHFCQLLQIELSNYLTLRDGDGTVVKVLCYKSEGRLFDPSRVIGFFIDIKSFRSHCGPGVDSAYKRNEYQECFLGVKSAGA